MSSMRAAVITAPGGPDVLAIRAVNTPMAGAHQILVRVMASALNRADLLQRIGRYPAPPGYPADIAGIEFAGEVRQCGDGVTRWRPGDRVFGITGGGAHAEYVAIHEDTVARVPERFSWLDAAAVPEAFITAHDAMITQADLRRGESVLIHAVASGVGLAAAQLGAALGARVFGITRSADKLQRASGFGMQEGLVVTDNWSALGIALGAFTGGRGVDVTLDLLGGPYLESSINAAGMRGRVMMIGAIAGAQATIDVRQVLGKRLRLQGTVLRSRGHAEKVEATAAFTRDVLPLLESGAVRPAVDEVFALDQIAEAHRRMESNQTFGKVVLDLT